MRMAIVSDIHGNFEAFREVLADVEHCGVDRIVCLGDSINYGPQPEEVVAFLLERGIPSAMGNHELAVADPSALEWFNPSARRSFEITLGLLSNKAIDYCRSLARSIVESGCLLVHGFPPDSVRKYLFEVPDHRLRQVLLSLPQEICFVGHTHDLALVTVHGTRVLRDELTTESISLPEGSRSIVNIGSVGQPRDGDNRAKYVIWDDAARRLEIRRVAYDVGRVAEMIIRLGFPRINADRLH